MISEFDMQVAEIILIWNWHSNVKQYAHGLANGLDGLVQMMSKETVRPWPFSSFI
jgi:hypothetical protein